MARSYACAEDKKTRIEARIVELVADPDPNPALFMRPEGARESVNCLSTLQPPAVVRQEDPPPPRKSPAGTAVVLALAVRTDGKPEDLKVLSTPHREFDQAALTAVRRWRFKPGRCDGEPMEMTIAVEMDFHTY